MLPKQENARLGRKVNSAPGRIPLGGKSLQKCIYSIAAQQTAKHHAKFGGLPLSDGAAVTDEAKTQTLLKFAGVSQTRQPVWAISGPKFTISWRRYCCLTSFFSIVDTCLSCEDIARQSCAMVRRWPIFASCILSEPRAAHFRPAF